MITYLSKDLCAADGGLLCLYLDKEIVQIVPRFGRTVVFLSEVVEHEVKPAHKQRTALTTWFSYKHRAQEAPLPPTGIENTVHPSKRTVFVAIPSYRDPELQLTVRDLFAKAECPDRIRVGIFL